MYALAFGTTVWEFAVHPESIEVTYPARTNATPTLTSAYLDHFGPGIGALSIAGTTGWGKRPGRPNGLNEIKRLIILWGNYLRTAAAADDPSTVTMTFADGYTGNSFLCAPDASGLRTQQSRASPMIVRYSMTLIILKDLSGGRVADAITVGLILPGVGAAAGVGASFGAQAQAFLAASVLNDPPRYYTVQTGDTLAEIANAYGVGADELALVNGIRFAQRLNAGVVLRIPG